MSIGLKGLKLQLEEEARLREERKFEKMLRDYELLKEGGGIIIFRISQELDVDAANYNPDRGAGLIIAEHATPYNPANPKGFRSARCTKETEGDCYGCERYADRDAENSKFWRAYTKVYVNALALSDGELKPFILGQKARSAVVEYLLEYAEDNDTITDTVFKLKKSGTGTDTKYSMLEQKKLDIADFNIDDFDLFNLENASPNIAYEKQGDFYNGVSATKVDAEKPAFSRAAASSNDEW